MNKKIVNIVFYQFFEKEDKTKKACIFYSDGTVADVSFDEGIDACETIVKERNITSKSAFREMINNDIIHVVSGKEFERNFQSYFPQTNENEAANRVVNNLIPVETIERDRNHDNVANTSEVEEPVATENNTVVPVVTPIQTTTGNNENVEENDEVADISEDSEIDAVNPEDIPENDIDVENVTDEDLIDDDEKEATNTRTNNGTNTKGNTVVVPIVAPINTNADNNTTNNNGETNDDAEEVSLDDDAEIEPVEENEENSNDAEADDLDNEIEAPTEKKGFWNRVKNSKVGKAVAGILAAAIAFGAGTGFGMWLHSKFDKKAAKNANNDSLSSINTNIESTESEAANIIIEDKENSTEATVSALKTGNNADYDNYTFEQLLEVTDNEVQKQTMANLDLAMSKFNGEFADAWVEEGKDVRPALTFDEIVSLQIAYNDFSKYDLHAIFNGSEIKAEKLSRAYKDATLQLMGAHVIESREHPVDMSMLINSEEGKEFYAKYHEAFLAAKEATGQDQIDKVTAFYNMVRSDFTVDPDKRMEGISHAEVYDIEPYKLSVTPMIAAAEMMFQNLNVDVTLNDLEVQFFNQLGLCNLADGAFRRAEIVTMACCQEDITNPKYDQFRKAIIDKYTKLGIYYIDDAHRELTKLDRFQQIVNGNREFRCGGWQYNTWVTESTSTRTEVNTWTETHTTYHEEETRTEKPIPDDVKARIDAEIEAENERRRREAEEAARQEEERLQRIEDENAQRIEEEIRQDEEELQQAIDDANERIDENNSDQDPSNNIPVNEDDFGDANVDFFDEYSDDQGNLDPSVENITTDPSGDQTGEPLPDPNETGEAFDAEAPKGEDTYNESNDSGSDDTYVEDNGSDTYYEDNSNDQEIYTYEETYKDNDNDTYVEDSGSDTSSEETYDNSSNDDNYEESYDNSSNDSYEQEVYTYEEPEESHNDYSEDAWVESVPVDNDYSGEDTYWVEEDSSSAKETYTYEELVDAYVEQLAELSDPEYEFGYQYTK